MVYWQQIITSVSFSLSAAYNFVGFSFYLFLLFSSSFSSLVVVDQKNNNESLSNCIDLLLASSCSSPLISCFSSFSFFSFLFRPPSILIIVLVSLLLVFSYFCCSLATLFVIGLRCRPQPSLGYSLLYIRLNNDTNRGKMRSKQSINQLTTTTICTIIIITQQQQQ